MKNILLKLGFDKKTLMRFLIIVSNSQLIYSFVALRSVLYQPMVDTLGVSNTEFGLLLGMLGFVANYGTLIFGWVQDRFCIRNILAINTFFYGAFGLIATLFGAGNFFILAICFIGFGFNADALYWPTVLKSVRSVANEKSQGTAFGFMEAIRGGWEFITNALGIAIFTILGSAIFGMKVAMITASALTIISGILVWIFIPKEEVLSGSDNKTKTAFKGLVTAFKMPEVWFTGIAASCVYATFAAVNTYFVPYMQNVYLLPASIVAVFGLVNGSVTRFTAGPIAGLVADLRFKSSAHLMRLCYLLLVVFFIVALVIPKASSLAIPTMILLLIIATLCFLIRGVYYAPIGELEISTDMSAAAMSVAAFIGYSPTFWAYPVYGLIIDRFGNVNGYSVIFVVLLVLSIVGAIFTSIIGRKIVKVRSLSTKTN